MIHQTDTTIAAHFMFVCEEEIVFCTSDLNAYKTHVHPHDIGQISSGDQVILDEITYEIDTIQIEHYFWPIEGHVINQAETRYAYTLNTTFNLGSSIE